MSPDDFASRLPIRTSCCPVRPCTRDAHDAGSTRREFLAATGGLGIARHGVDRPVRGRCCPRAEPPRASATVARWWSSRSSPTPNRNAAR